MLGTLENSFHAPSYLLQILRDYLKDRSLLYQTLEEQRRIKIMSGVTQGSIQGRTLLVKEPKATYHRNSDNLREVITREERQRTLTE